MKSAKKRNVKEISQQLKRYMIPRAVGRVMRPMGRIANNPYPEVVGDAALAIPSLCSLNPTATILCDRNRCRSRNPRRRKASAFFMPFFRVKIKRCICNISPREQELNLKTIILGAEFSHFCEGSAPFLKCLSLKGRNSKNATRSYQGVRLYRQALINGCAKSPIKNRTRFVRKQRKTIIIKY